LRARTVILCRKPCRRHWRHQQERFHDTSFDHPFFEFRPIAADAVSRGFDRLGGIAFASDGTLYGVSGASAQQGTLMTIDPTNGTPTVIGLLSDPNAAVDGLRFNSQGVLYGGSFNNSKGVGQLLTIDPSDGTVLTSLTLVGSGNSFCPGIAFDSKDVLFGSRGNSSGRLEDLDLIDQVDARQMGVDRIIQAGYGKPRHRSLCNGSGHAMVSAKVVL